MNDHTRLKGLVQARINEFLAEKRSALKTISEDLTPVFDELENFLAGGKRFRAYCLLLGFRSATQLRIYTKTPEVERVVNAAAALELFHAAALVHDDIIDRSDTRRGRPAVHRVFDGLHTANSWKGSASHFGISVALLVGDILQSWADELFQSAIEQTQDPDAGREARAQFNRMRTEVAYGQYFDALEEQHMDFSEHSTQLERSTRILLYKSAKYSVEAPLLIGASLAGADGSLLEVLSGYGIPVGVAFQLRDDILGVFGDPEITGKPSGDDLIEGKRTVLVTLAREPLPLTQRRVFDEMLGDALSDDQVFMMQRTIRDSGALAQVEEMIQRNIGRAQKAARHPEIASEAVEQLVDLADKMGRRDY
ncbi:MAG: polyprenyl synthetase family protein [Canibacter sp.]